MNSHEFELWIEQYKAIVKERGAERPLFPDEIKKLDENIDYIPDDYKSAFILALGGDYSKFEKLPQLLRNYLGALELKKFREKFDDAPSLESKAVREYLENNAMNAALRAGITAEKNAADTKESAMALDTYMSQILMKRTMMPPSAEGRERLVSTLGNEAFAEEVLRKNRARQLVLAKSMLLAQIGKFDLIGENGLGKELDVPVYETLVHGSRTNFVLPTGKSSGNVIDAFMGRNDGADVEIRERTAATHSVKRRSVDQNGVLISEVKELRTYNPFRIFQNQYGMDIAAGGVGELGPDQNVITGNGSSGHMYIRAEKGDVKHGGSLLIGIEGSAPGMSDSLGNAHDFRAKSAKQSPFLADKTIVGKKIGGRQIDLSGVSSEKLTQLLNTFSQKYSALQRDGETPEGREKLAKINDMLMGKRLDEEALTELMGELGMSDEKTLNVISNTRRGYLNKINVSEVTEAAFKQSIRATFSQEQACSLAKARFESAGKNVVLSVSAIKELMLTHETRSLGWKIRHPIKNYREYATISSLKEKLTAEKKFKAEEIASNMRSNRDTCVMDWGGDLSYDRDVLLFVQEKATLFKPLAGKLPSESPKPKSDLSIEADSAKTKKTVEKAFEKAEPRDKLVIHEVKEDQKGAELSQEIVSNQQILENGKHL